MSITIRLARTGKKNSPAYKVVVANTKSKRNGRSLEILGHFNPSTNPVSFDIDKKKMDKWTKEGALVTESVTKLIKGTYKYVPYKPKAEKTQQPAEKIEG